MTRPDQRSGDEVPRLVNQEWTHPELFYGYRKLETPASFRLLHLESVPRSSNAPLQYSLLHTTFDEAPSYDCVSYVWGTTDRTETVPLSDGKFLRITEPLKKALPFVERHCETKYLWIDQICIDQDDRSERGDQVKIMGHIYSSCHRVLVWLGQMAHLDIGLPFEDDLKQEQSPKGRPVQKKSTMRQFMHRLREGTGLGQFSTKDNRQGLLQSEWFQRAWVFQEIILPGSALFILTTASGISNRTVTMSLPDLHTMANHEILGTNVDVAVTETIRFMYRCCNEQRRDHGQTHLPIEQILSLLAPRAKTTEDLDRLYAFFGLNFDVSINLTPSYDYSLEMAMIATATSIIEGTTSLDIFEVIPRAVERTTNNTELPTWTPDFREEQLVAPFKRSKANFKEIAKSCPERCPVFISTTFTYYRGTIYCAGEEKRTIQASGFVLDQVDIKIGTLLPRTNLEDQVSVLLKRCVKAWKKIASCAEDYESFASNTKRENPGLVAFTADLGLALAPTKARLLQALTAEMACATSDESSTPSESYSGDSYLRKMHSVMTEVMRGRTLWMTRSGRLALGSYLHSGDHICLVYGSSNPIALRGDDQMMKVLGTCFLEQWMDPWSSGKIERAEKEFKRKLFHFI